MKVKLLSPLVIISEHTHLFWLDGKFKVSNVRSSELEHRVPGEVLRTRTGPKRISTLLFKPVNVFFFVTSNLPVSFFVSFASNDVHFLSSIIVYCPVYHFIYFFLSFYQYVIVALLGEDEVLCVETIESCLTYL